MISFQKLASVSLAILSGLMAYTFCFTLNEQAFGGYLPFLILTMAPVLGHALGRIDE